MFYENRLVLPEKKAKVDQQKSDFIKHVGQTSLIPHGLEVAHAKGMYIFDTKGEQYLDLNAGIAVSSMGHSHPNVLEAIKTQSEKYLHTMVYGEHIQAVQVSYAKLLSEQLDESLSSVFYVTSGTEATEGAMKLSRRVTGRYELIACKNAYHGSTLGAESLMSQTWMTQAYRPHLPGIRFIEFNNIESLSAITEKTAGVFIELVQGCAGVQVIEKAFLQALKERCVETGALLIFDEIQTGFGRTGKLFAHQHWNILPDIMLIAKAMGGGMPIGAFVSSKKYMDHFTDDPPLGHINTFGGHPVCVAAAQATLETLLESDLISRVDQKAELLIREISHASIKEIRHKGLMIGVDLADAVMLKKFLHAAKEARLLIDTFLFNETSFRLAPPLIITEEEIKLAGAKITSILNNL